MTYSNSSYDSSDDATNSSDTSSSESSSSSNYNVTESTSGTGFFSNARVKYAPIVRTEDQQNRFFVNTAVEDMGNIVVPRANEYGLAYNAEEADALDDILDEIPPELIEKIQRIQECAGQFRIQLKEGKKEYKEEEINKDLQGDLLPQFENCPDEDDFVYQSGWQWEDARTGSYTGAVPGGVLAWRTSDIGPPLKKDSTDTHNPGRVMNLPNNAVTMIHNEPVTIVWVHPYLERGEGGRKEGNSEAGPERNEMNLGFSLYNTDWAWQSGPAANSPTNSDSLMNAGFWSQAGGLNSLGNKDEAKMYYRRAFQSHEASCFRMGYSRGNDTILYGDSATEGLEYGVVGMSGFVSALPNLAFGQEYNSGISHAYTINRICTNGDELKANIQKFVEWLQDFIEFIQDGGGADLLPDGFPQPGGGAQEDSFSVSANSILDSVSVDPETGKLSDDDSKKVGNLAKMVGKWADYAETRDAEVDPEHVPYISCADLIESGFIDRMKQPWTPDERDEATLSLFFEFAGRVGPENDGVNESQKQFNVSPDFLFERIARGEPLTRLDVFRSFFTRCVLRDERLARQFGEFDIEKFGLAALGRIPRKEIRNERFFLYLINRNRDEIGDFEFENGTLVAKYKSGFSWNAEDFEADGRGFLNAAERIGAVVYAEGSNIIAARRQDNGTIGDPIAIFDDDFNEHFKDIAQNAFYQADVANKSTFAESPNNEYGGDEGSKQRLLYSETTASGKTRYSHPGDKIDTVQIKNVPTQLLKEDDDKPYDYQRWTGGYCYPISGGSPGARPDWDILIKTQAKGSYKNHSWDCTEGEDKENVWYVHTYGPFKEREMKRYYYFMIPLRRNEASGRMDYGIAWWWNDDPKAPNASWKPSKSGSKNPLDAYEKNMTPETPWEVKAASKYSSKCFYQMVPPKKYFRVSFYQWIIPKSEFVGAFPGHAGSGTLKGPEVKSYLYPPMACGKKNPGTEDGRHPHGVRFDFAVFVAQGDNPWEDNEPSSNELTGPVYWTDTEWKVAKLADDHYQQPVNILEPFPNGSGIYRFTPVPTVDHELLEGEVTPMMSVHMSPDGMDKGRDPVGNPGYRERYSPHMTTIREMPVNLMIDVSKAYSVAGWYPEEEHGGAHPPLEGGARRSVEQWSINGEPWLKITPVSLEDGANGPGYWGNLGSKNSRPNFHNVYFQTPLHYFGQRFHTYHEPQQNKLPVVGKRMLISSLAKGARYKNELTGEYEDWDTKEDYDVYFAMRDEVLDIGYNRFENLDTRIKFKYAFTLPKGGTGIKDHYVTCPTDKMLFHAVNTRNEFGPKEITEWNCDGERVNIESRYHTGPRDHLKGPAYWTKSGDSNQNRNWVGENGYVDFHDLYWKNELTHYNDAVAAGNDKIVAGREYEITYQFGTNDVPTSSGGNADSRLRIIFGNTEASINPAFEYDPGFEKTIPSITSAKIVKDKRLYTYTDIVLEPGKKAKFTAETDIMFFGVFNVKKTAGPNNMGQKFNWSINGQGVNVTCKEVVKKPGCSLFVSSETVNPIPNNDRRSITQWDKYKLPYMHLTKEIAFYRNHTDDAIPGKVYDGGRLPLVTGRKYRLATTAFTPIGYEYRLYFVDQESALNNQQLTIAHMVDDGDILPKLVLKKVKGSPNESYIEFTALSPYLMLETWNAQLDEAGPDNKRTYEDWSEEGEPAFLKLSYAEDGIIEGVQYWTDAQGNEADKAAQLKSKHWLSPMHPLKPLGVENPNAPGEKVYIETKPDTRYEIEVLDREDNPDYVHKIFLGPKPNAYRPGEPCSYKSAVSMRKGETKTFDTGVDKFIIILGSTATSRTLEDWNRDGEPLFVKLKEVYKDPIVGPVYPGDHLDKEEFDWNEWTERAVDEYGLTQMFANPSLDIKVEEEIDTEDDVTDENKYFTKVHSAGEANTDKTPKPQTGSRYRISCRTDYGSINGALVPEDFEDDLPYALRVWNYRNERDVDPTTFKPDNLKGNRVFFPHLKPNGTPYATYCDFVAEDSNIIFGAAGLKGRDIFTWSRKGEPTNVKIEKLPYVATSGPAYWASYATRDRPPAIEDKHFLKPLNIYRGFRAGNEYQAKGIVDQMNSTTRIWWVLDMTDPTIEAEYDRKSTNEPRQLTNCPLKWDPAHPEDLMCENFTSMHEPLEFQWEGVYLPGPILTKRAGYEYEYFKVPQKVVGAIFAVYKEGGGPGASRAANDATNDITDWNMDGQPLQWEFAPREKDTRKGPVYWGNNTPVNGEVPFSFTDQHFTELNKVSLIPGKEYNVKQKGGENDWKDYNTIDLYTYSSSVVNESDPKDNIRQKFTKVGTFNKTDTSIVIEAETGLNSHDSVLASARAMTATNRTLESWSPNGEPEPFILQPKPEVIGPVYWGDAKNNTGPEQTWAKHMPNFGRDDKWKGYITHMLCEEGAVYNLKVIAGIDINYDYSLYFANDNDALDPKKAKSSMWHKCTDLGTLLRSLGDLTIGSEHTFQAEGRYLSFGAINTEADGLGEYSFEKWSRKGEPAPFRIQKQQFPRGPVYPAMDKKNAKNKFQTDLEHKRWNRNDKLLLTDPILPRWSFGNKTFSHGITYKLKVKENTIKPWEYTFHWVSTMDNLSGKYMQVFDATIKLPTTSWSARAGGKVAYLAKYSATGTGTNALPKPQSNSMSAWSPDGYPFKFKATIDWMELIPPNWWKWLLLLAALLGALLAVYAYLTLTAPTDVLLQMTEDHENTEYSIKRYKEKTDDKGNVIGYGYPNVEDPTRVPNDWGYGPEMLYPRNEYVDQGIPFPYNVEWDTQPKYFNWTADPLTRAWARIMKLRHNGYMFHLSRNYESTKYDSIIKDSYTAEHVITLANVTQTFGIGYSKLSLDSVFKYEKVFRYYTEYGKDGKGDFNVDRFNPYDLTGVKVIQVDTQTNPLKQRKEWHNDLQWFDADYSYMHFCRQDTIVESRGGARYKSAISLSDTYTKYLQPAGPSYGPKAMFTSLGWGVTTDHYFDTNTSSHAYVWEVLNCGDPNVVDDWPGLSEIPATEDGEESYRYYYPIIEFDMDIVDGNTQLNQVHVNYEKMFFGEVGEKMARKMVVDNGSYVMRDSFENTHSRDNFNQGSQKKLRLRATEPVEMYEWKLASISFCFWIGTGKGKKGMIVKNLKADSVLLKPSEI